MEAAPLGEYVLTEKEARGRNFAGDWVAEGGSDWRKDAGEEGGAMKGITMVAEWFKLSGTGTADPGTVGSGTRTALPMRLLFLTEPKHQ